MTNKYRKKPVVIEAKQFTALTIEQGEELASWCGGKLCGTALRPEDRVIKIDTLEGEMEASHGDWIIRGVKGEFYPCKPDVFAITYELALNAQPEAQADGCHCATCTCAPGMTPAVRFDTSPAEREGAVRDHLIRMGWTPPQQPAAGVGEEIMVNAAHGVFTLPLRPSGLSSGPRFVVHVPGPEQPAAVDGAMREEGRT